ncbi:hypothetical protein LWI29_033603 [Acer saccharum]|uniref:RNase H type-1 domain-containing protein n=1 Tax=Acer saccharum TaxID=4024 RepID=A0AA39VR76_ACESA|nr:hypothetical protein LWI29_033603 [Acer saccharum]
MTPHPDTIATPSLDLESLEWPTDCKAWILYMDGTSNQAGCGARIILTDPKGIEFSHCFRFEFKATNNEAEYKALLVGMRVVEELGADFLLIRKDPDQARKLKRAVTRYCLVKGYLYRKGKSLSLLRCLHPDDAQWAPDEVHTGDCGNHVSGETLAYQVLRMGYFWLTLHQDAKKFAQSCEPC